MNDDSKLYRDLFGAPSHSGRTDLSRRREQEQRDQRRMFGYVDPQGRRY